MKIILTVCALFLIFPDALKSQDFTVTDKHALSAQQNHEASVRHLADYLTSPFSDELHKSRAIYRWITDRIEYDAVGFARGITGSVSPEMVLQVRKAQCNGYAALFQALSSAAGLESVTITGHSRGYGYQYDPNDELVANHAWNAVRINGTWRLLDPTWGAGYIDSDTGRFVKRFEDFYFLTEPQKFILDHFPDDPDWQLLDTPVSKNEYREMARVRPSFFRHGLSLESHQRASIEVSGSETITLSVPEDQIVSARLTRNGVPLPLNQVMVHHIEERAVIEFAPPQRGSYELEIFAKEAGAGGDFNWVLTYSVKSNREIADSGYPETYGRYLTQRSSVEEPKSYVLNAGEKTRFSITVPGAVSVTVVNGETWADLEKDGERFTGEIVPVPGLVQVAARFGNEEVYSVLLEYQAR